jgi:predicted Co/Zn/Cd cation transporter (cation efflux family)
MLYGAGMMVVCFGMSYWEHRSNQRIKSQFIRLDMQSWLMSGVIGAGLLVAFGGAVLAQGTRWEPWARYADPAILALLTSVMLFVPLGAVIKAVKQIFQVAPQHLDQRVRGFMDNLVRERGFVTYSSYVARVGRAQFIEIYIVLPRDFAIGSVDVLDKIRAEIGEFIGNPGPQRWLTITFTGDAKEI